MGAVGVPDARGLRVGAVDRSRWADCRALWLALRDHSGDVEPHLGPVRSDEESWRMAFERWGAALEAPDAFLVLAEDDNVAAPLGCAVVTVTGGSPSWELPARHGYVEVLALAPDRRGQGIGTRIIQVVRDELARQGIVEVRLLVTAHNVRAQNFYAGVGFEPFGHMLRLPPAGA